MLGKITQKQTKNLNIFFPAEFLLPGSGSAWDQGSESALQRILYPLY